MRHAPAKRVLILAVMTALPGCAGVQSVLDPGGPAAARIALLAWVLFGLCGAIFLAVLTATWVAIRGPRAARAGLASVGSVVIGGIVSSTLLTLIVLPALFRIAHARERRPQTQGL